MNTAAVEWLEAIFDQTAEDRSQIPADEYPGFSWVRPMFEFLPILDDGWTAMTVTSADYLDRGRCWL